MLVLMVPLAGCSIKKHIPADKYLLTKVAVKGAPGQSGEDLYTLSKQKPNRKFAGVVRLKMWLYLLSKKKNDPEKKKEKIANNTWEEPVLLDSALLGVSTGNMEEYLFNNGYFHGKVNYEIKTKGRKAGITYLVTPGDEFKIRNLKYQVEDSALAKLVLEGDTTRRRVKNGDQYDGDVLAEERDRLTNLFRNEGYWNFSREYITFEVDSHLEGNLVDVGLRVDNPVNRPHHWIYRVKNIYVEPEYIYGDTIPKDSFEYTDQIYISKQLRIKAPIVADFVFFNRDSLYRQSDYQSTLGRLGQIGIYKFIDVNLMPDTSAGRDTGLMDILIRLTPLKRQGITANLELNTTQENTPITADRQRLYGTSVGLTYRNRIIAKLPLLLDIGARGSIESPFSGAAASFDYGFNASLSYPTLLLPFAIKDRSLRLSSTTALSGSWLSERTEDYSRRTLTGNLAYNLRYGRYRFTWVPLEVSLINTYRLSDGFETQLQDINDPFYRSLFDRHILTSSRYGFIINQQPIGMVQAFYWMFRVTGEVGGFDIFARDALFDKARLEKDTIRRLGGIDYYQYLRLEPDIRAYLPVGRYTNLAGRFALGLGTPYANSSIMPFEKRFYVGGPNSIRAFNSRKLGPGLFQDPDGRRGNSYDQSGDIKLETSLEYRFPIYSFLKGALFADAGNVWLLRTVDTIRTQSQLPFAKGADPARTIIGDIAVGAGAGIRLDFNFFVIRLDVAKPVKYPKIPKSPSLSPKVFLSDAVLSIGIGYPF